jgi:hypothetical protein
MVAGRAIRKRGMKRAKPITCSQGEPIPKRAQIDIGGSIQKEM